MIEIKVERAERIIGGRISIIQCDIYSIHRKYTAPLLKRSYSVVTGNLTDTGGFRDGEYD